MNPARRTRSGRHRMRSRSSERTAVASIPSTVAKTSGTPSGPLNAYAASAPKAMKSPYAKLTSRRIPYTIDTPTAPIAITDPVTRPLATSCRNTSDELRLGNGSTFGEAPRVEHGEQLVAAVVEQRVRHDARDGGRDHEAVAAEPGRDPDAVVHLGDDRLVVGRHVVLALHEERERDVREDRQQLVDHQADVREVAPGEVAGEHTAVPELLRREA